MTTLRPRKLRSRVGQGSVEFAFACVFFFLMILGLFDLVRVCYQWGVTQYAVSEAGRTGILNGNTTALTNKFNTLVTSLGIPASTLYITDIATGNNIPLGTTMAQGSFFELNVTTPVTLTILGGMANKMGFPSIINVTAKTIVQNEPFP